MTRTTPRRTRVRLALVALAVIGLFALAATWAFSPLARALDLHAIESHAQQVRAWPLAGPVAIGLFVVGGLVAAPSTLMIGATVVLFGAWPGVPYAFVGMMLNGILIYTLGRHAARDLVDAWLARRAGSKLNDFNRLLARRGFVAIALIRMTPIPYTLQNVMAGAARVTVADFLLGTSIGLIPVFVVMTIIATGLGRWLTAPTPASLAIGAGVALVGLASLRLIMRRRRRIVE